MDLGKCFRVINIFLLVLVVIMELTVSTHAGNVDVLNLRNSSVAVRCNNASGYTILPYNNSITFQVPDDGFLLIFACDPVDNECIMSSNPTATMAKFSKSSGTITYELSVISGYNFPAKIICNTGSSLPIICAVDLNYCPENLQILNSSDAVAACKPLEDCSNQQCENYSQQLEKSHCQTPTSSHGPSRNSTCSTSAYLTVQFID